MKSFYLDSHSVWCHQNEIDTILNARRICAYNPVEFLLFMKNQFILVKINPCMKIGSIPDTVLDIVQSATKSNNIYEFWDVEKSKLIKRNIEKCIETGEIVSQNIYTINYLYNNNFHGKKCIATKSNIVKELINVEDFEANYLTAKEWLFKNEKEYLIEELNDLYYANKIRVDDSYIIKSVDKLIKVINKQI